MPRTDGSDRWNKNREKAEKKRGNVYAQIGSYWKDFGIGGQEGTRRRAVKEARKRTSR